MPRHPTRPTRSSTPPRSPGRPRLADADLADRRSRYLDCASTIFAKRGYRETDVQEIADAAKVGKATIYRHFPSKIALFNAAIEHGITAMQRAIHAAIALVTTPVDQLRIGIGAYLAYWNAHPDLVELLVQQRAEFRGGESERCLHYREQGKAETCALFRRLIDAGVMRAAPPEQLAEMLFDLLYGTMFFNRLLGRTKPLTTQADALLDLFFHGSLTSAGRRQFARSSPFRRQPTAQGKP